MILVNRRNNKTIYITDLCSINKLQNTVFTYNSF